MCGIAGYIGTDRISEGLISSTLDLMKNRGPDHRAYAAYEGAVTNVYLLHSRLSIIDLDERSNQPFEKAHCSLVFNGEIYNYIELRRNLEKEGVVFTTESDTEVLINYYLKYGERCVDYFEGMWAFAIFDKKNNKLFLSRDRFAEKPLYYYRSGTGFYFGSEIKLLKELSQRDFPVNYEHLKRYLVNGSKALYKAKQTFFSEVQELSFASNMIVGAEGRTEAYAYWRPQYNPQPISEADAVEGVRQHLINSLKLRLRSDVPLAFCLSGGVDSASLVSIASKELGADVSTFSILDRDARYDERENIDATVRDIGCTNVALHLDSAEENVSRLEALIDYHDAPVATISYLVHSMLSEAISERGFKISISGTGSDEIFTGYYDHFNLHLYEIRNDPEYSKYLDDWRKYPAKYVRNPQLQNPELYFQNPGSRSHIFLNSDEFSSYLKDDFRESFSEEHYSDSLLRNRMMNELFHEVVRTILNEDDLNSMKYSVENRSPFLDKSLLEFVNTIPNKMLIKNGYAKYLLRESMAGVLNDKVRLEREKKGFNASINSIFDFEDSRQLEWILSDSAVYDIVDRQKIAALIKKKDHPNSFKKFLFNFINCKIFLD